MTSAPCSEFNTPDRLDELACEVLALAELPGIDAAEVAITTGDGLAVTVRDGAC